MDKKSFIWLNGNFVQEDQPAIPITNRAFSYGDGLFETIHAYGTEGKHLDLHFTRISKSMRILQLEPPPYFSLSFMAQEISRLLNKNRIFDSARVRLTVFRNAGGLYTPTTNQTSIAIQAAPLPQKHYPLNQKGLVVDIFTDIRKPINSISSIKSCNSLIYIMAGLHKVQSNIDDCLLINDKNRIVEAISSNIFLVFGNKVYTPGLSEGCIPGVMRELVIRNAPSCGYQVFDSEQIKPQMLVEADELFLTNAITGIKWIVGLRHKRYFGMVSRKISQLINTITFPT